MFEQTGGAGGTDPVAHNGFTAWGCPDTNRGSGGEVEVFDTTNKYFQFALDQMQQTYGNVSHADLSRWLDNLLPVALKEMGFRPALRVA